MKVFTFNNLGICSYFIFWKDLFDAFDASDFVQTELCEGKQQVLRTSEEMMPRLHEALDIQDPKLIIRIVPCFFGRRYWEHFSDEVRASAFRANMVPQLCDADEEKVGWKMCSLHWFQCHFLKIQNGCIFCPGGT